MDPLAAFSVAGTIAQFIQFTASLIHESAEILQSASSAAKDVENAGVVYSTLLDFDDKLGRSLEGTWALSYGGVSRELKSLVKACSEDCRSILEITKSLTARRAPRNRLQSMGMAMRAEWQKLDIEKLDNRLRRSQITLGVVMSFVSSEYQREHDTRLTMLQKQSQLHQLNQERQFSELRRLLFSLNDQVSSLRSIDPCSGSKDSEVEVERLGVFLWVFLVTSLLRKGLTNDDSFDDLSRRLASFPSDLEAFFDHMIRSVEPFYHEKMAGTLMIAKTAAEPLDILFYDFHDREHDDKHYFKHIPLCVQEEHELLAIEERVERRINAYSKGLLEVRNRQVVFLHRAVADFLNLRRITRRLKKKCPSWFRPELSCARAHVGILKTRDLSSPHRDGILPFALTSHVTSVMALSALFDGEPGEIRDEFYLLLNEVESAISRRPPEDNGQVPDEEGSKSFRQLILRFGNPNYIDEVLQRDAVYFDNLKSQPLCLLLCDGPPAKHMENFMVLLRHGADPNREYNVQSTLGSTPHKQTPWTKLMSLSISQNNDIITPSEPQASYNPGLLGVFLRHGANPNAVIYNQHTGRCSPAWINILFACFKQNRSHEAAYLERVGPICKNKGVRFDWASAIECCHPAMFLQQPTQLLCAHTVSVLGLCLSGFGESRTDGSQLAMGLGNNLVHNSGGSRKAANAAAAADLPGPHTGRRRCGSTSQEWEEKTAIPSRERQQ
ncbi:hypothetical protein PG987_010355 [Apiospora arundinis]